VPSPARTHLSQCGIGRLGVDDAGVPILTATAMPPWATGTAPPSGTGAAGASTTGNPSATWAVTATTPTARDSLLHLPGTSARNSLDPTPLTGYRLPSCGLEPPLGPRWPSRLHS